MVEERRLIASGDVRSQVFRQGLFGERRFAAGHVEFAVGNHRNGEHNKRLLSFRFSHGGKTLLKLRRARFSTREFLISNGLRLGEILARCEQLFLAFASPTTGRDFINCKLRSHRFALTETRRLVEFSACRCEPVCVISRKVDHWVAPRGFLRRSPSARFRLDAGQFLCLAGALLSCPLLQKGRRKIPFHL